MGQVLILVVSFIGGILAAKGGDRLLTPKEVRKEKRRLRLMTEKAALEKELAFLDEMRSTPSKAVKSKA